MTVTSESPVMVIQIHGYPDRTFLLPLFFFFLCFTEDVTALKVNKPKAEDDLSAEETSSEDEDELTQEGLELKDMLERDEGKESSDEDEDEEDPDRDEMKGTSALFLQG